MSLSRKIPDFIWYILGSQINICWMNELWSPSIWVIVKFFNTKVLLPRRSLKVNQWQLCSFFVRHTLFAKHYNKISQNQSRLGVFKINHPNSFWHCFSGIVVILSSLQVYVSTAFSLHNYQPSFIMMPITHTSSNKWVFLFPLAHSLMCLFNTGSDPGEVPDVLLGTEDSKTKCLCSSVN